ncbi:MAG: isoprenylcysteine carboxylmethyltransferase family protein [Anaerolineales bacterium]|jgi:protein-S-isoprenylcysteine O-methyltransferase Ste14|nr:isoprenylcysteine carboxylmethyltransferase family protein [Anaerolineales bacterium]
MSRAVKVFLLVIAPILALLLALLGFWSVPANPTGWFLLLVGVGFTVGLILDYAVRKKRFWEAASTFPTAREERSDRSFWFISLGMIAAFYISPVEYLFAVNILPRNTWIAWIGVAMSTIGAGLFVWARRALGDDYSGHLSVKPDQTLVQKGPYRFIRHPAYAGYLLMALGISLGYASLLGLLSTLVMLLPSLTYRMKVEERLLSEHFGEAYSHYARATHRLIPGIW